MIKRLKEKEAVAAVQENRPPREIRDFHPHTLRHTFATRCFENKFGGYSSKGSGLEHSKIPAKPVKYIVPAIYDWNPEKGKFAKQMNK